jgi:hypothetical protein
MRTTIQEVGAAPGEDITVEWGETPNGPMLWIKTDDGGSRTTVRWDLTDPAQRQQILRFAIALIESVEEVSR